MALGALIGAYQEDDSGGLRALLPLAGRTLVEYQVRCAAAAGAAPVVVIVERVPQALQDAFERLRLDGVGVVPVSDVHEAVSRFEAGSMIVMIGMMAGPLVAGILLTAAGLGAAAMATADPLRTKRLLIFLAAALVSLGAAAILLAVARMFERFW